MKVWMAPLVVSLGAHSALAAVLLTVPTPKRLQRATMELVDRQLPPTPPPVPKQPSPEPQQPKPDPPKKVRRRLKKPPTPTPPEPVEPPAGEPEAAPETPPDTAPQTFGIPEMTGETRAPSGAGVRVPTGDTVRASPLAKKRGPAPKGFKKRYQVGEQAPIAVITTRPMPAKKVEPEYSEQARELGIEGRVVVELLIDERGRVRVTRILKSLHPDLDAAAVAAAKQMIFKPATVNGTPVKVKIPYGFVYVLE